MKNHKIISKGNNSIYKDLLFLIRNRYISIDYNDILYEVYLEKTIFYGEENEANISIRLINRPQ
jgi:hypothetical protein